MEFESFLKGLLGIEATAGPESEDLAIDPAYIPNDISTFSPTKPMDSVNGTAVLNAQLGYSIVLRASLLDHALAPNTLQEIASVIDRAEGAALRFPQSVRPRGRLFSLCGFSTRFFKSAPGPWQKEMPCAPTLLKLVKGDQTDLYLAIESDSHAVAREAASALLSLANLRVVEVIEGYRSRSGLGLFGSTLERSNPTLESSPSIADAVFCVAPTEPLTFREGTYLLHHAYALDENSWHSTPEDKRDALTGLERTGSADPQDSTHQDRIDMISRRTSFDREFSFLRPGVPFQRGICWQSFCADPSAALRRADRVFSRDNPLIASGLLAPQDRGVYAVPSARLTAFPGQQFFEPERYEKLLTAEACFRTALYDDALSILKSPAMTERPLPGTIELLGRCYLDLGDTDKARKWLSRADPSRPVSRICEVWLAWLRYMEEDWTGCIELAVSALLQPCSESVQSRLYHILGAALLRTEEPEMALHAFQESARRVNIVPVHCFGYASALEQLGRQAEAAKIYDRTLEVVHWLVDQGEIYRRDVRTCADLSLLQHQTGDMGVAALGKIRLALANTGL